MPVIRVSREVYQAIIVEAGKRGCTIGRAADALFSNMSVKNTPVALHNKLKETEVVKDEKATNLQGREGRDILGTPRRHRTSPDLSEL